MGAWTLSAVGAIAARLLLSLGVSFLLLTGFGELLTYARSLIETQLGVLGSNVMNFLGLCGADFLVNGLLGGYAALLAMSATKKLFMK